MTMTLAQLEAGRVARGGDVTEKKTYHVGRSGSTYAGKTGDKIHVLIDFGRLGFEGACGGRNNGRGRVSPVEGLDTDAVTCTKCLSWLQRMEKYS